LSVTKIDVAYTQSVLEVLNECLLIEVSPVIDLDFLVEWRQLLLDLILGSSVDELFLGCGNVRGVEDQYDLRFDSSISSRVLKLEDAISATVLGQELLELLEGAISGSKMLEDNLCLVVVNLEDHISVSSLHSESNELSGAFVCNLNTA
jgi:hypothetical protein